LQGSWFNIEKDKLFCLLGPNGAGKTTTINCLTGIIPTTAGDGLVYGDSIRSTAGIANIRKNMGVCPQFDVLWESLSAREHLHVFGSLKGLSGADIGHGTEELLSQVKLVEAANVRAGSYSGGMKRRLSVAIALIGDPKVVYLDEPVSCHFIHDVSL
jgi:ABC-type multidrug transport system ATPase subunit